jgi:hypothetical protein
VTGVVYDTLHTDEGTAGDAEMAHELFCVSRTEIGLFHHLLLLISELKGEVILGKFLGFELLSKSSPANGTESESLLFKLDQTHFTECVTAVQITRDTYVAIEVLIARWTFHSCL